MASILLAIPVTIAILILHQLLLKIQRNKPQLPPGPWGLPLLGSLPFLNSKLLHRSLADICRNHGPVSSFRLGSRQCVTIASSKAATEILRDQDTVFASHPPPAVASIVTKGGKDIIWAPYGPHWRFGRRIAMRELLNSTVIDSFRSLRRREVHRMVRTLQSNAGKVVNIREAVSSTALDVILGMMWNNASREGTGKISALAKEMKEVIDGVVDVTGVSNISDFVPTLAPMDLQGLQRKMRGLSKRYDALFDTIRDSKKKVVDGGNGVQEKPKDFLQLMLGLIDRTDLDMPLEFEHIKSIILDLITGAMDTTTGTIEWAMSELVRHPNIMAKVQKELDDVVGKDGILEESHIPKLHYLDAVVRETLRLYPVLPLMIPHTPSETSMVSGYIIPKDARVFVNVWAIQRDPSAWEQPDEFIPERFTEEKSKFDYSGKNFDYLPFGKGRRICAGMNLGERMVLYMLGTLMHSIDWNLPEGVADLDMQEKFMVVLHKKKALTVVPSVRLVQYSQVD